MADYVSPDQRRRIAGRLMTDQYDRATPEEGNVAQRHGLLPLATYDNGRTGLAFPGFVAEPVQSFNRLLKNGYTPGDTQGVEDAFNVAGAAMLGGFAAPKPASNAVGMFGGRLGAENLAKAGERSTGNFVGYHGTEGGPFTKFDPNRTRSNAPFPTMWVTPEASRARFYAGPDGSIMETRVGEGRYLDYKTPDGQQAIRSAFGSTEDMTPHWRNFSENPDAVRTLKDSGYDGVWMTENMGDDSLAVWSPGKITQDPSWRNLWQGNTVFANGGRPGAATGAALGAIPDTPGIRAYHGSPHDFDRFDMSKIGTGEGAQAYGHGLYFAENEGVAKSYRDGLSSQKSMPSMADAMNAAEAAAPELKNGPNSISSLIAPFANYPDPAAAMRTRAAKSPDPVIQRAYEAAASSLEGKGPGRMYEVNIKANPDDFLDWDKRLGEQSANVRDKVKSLMLASREIPDDPAGAYKQAIERYNAGPKATALTDDPGVIQAYDAMRLARQGDKAFDRQKIGALLQESGRWSPEDARRTFLDAGIPGVKYLDRGSRTAGDGTSNYVVFDDKLIEILRKYGLLGMAGGAAAAEYGGNPLMPSRPASNQYRPGDA